MSQARKHLTAVGDAVGPIIAPNMTHAAIFVPAGAVGTFVLEVGPIDAAVDTDYVARKLTDSTNAAVDNLLGGVAAQYARCEIHGAQKVRVRKSAGLADNDATILVTVSETSICP